MITVSPIHLILMDTSQSLQNTITKEEQAVRKDMCCLYWIHQALQVQNSL